MSNQDVKEFWSNDHQKNIKKLVQEEHQKSEKQIKIE